MKLFDRLSNGWRIGKISLKTIKENPSLMLFPVISGFSLVLVTLSFFGGGYMLFGENIIAAADSSSGGGSETAINAFVYLLVFVFYLINYFVIVFFNVGLVHCAKMILEGKETSVGEGINYALTRISSIFAWAVLAATVGLILKTIQERAGALGGIITSVIGMVWGIATYFVVPIIAYEDVSPFEAVKRSGQMIKEKWGESIGANFSFGLFTLIGILFVAIPVGYLLGAMINPIVGIVAGIIIFLLVQTAVSAANMVFLAAAYQHINEEPTGYFENDVLDDMFMQK